MILIVIACFNVNNNTGIKKLRATIILEKNVEIVDSHISLLDLFLCPDSSEIWIPIESEKASAIAIVKIPAITTIFECVPAFNPTIKPRVVIIPEVNPNPTPFLIEIFIIKLREDCLKGFLNQIWLIF